MSGNLSQDCGRSLKSCLQAIHSVCGLQVLGSEPLDEAAAARLFAAMARYPDASTQHDNEDITAALASLSIGFRPEVTQCL